MPRQSPLPRQSCLGSFRRLIRVVGLAATVATFPVAIASAQAPVKRTWTGGAGDGKWDTGGNWNPPGVPARSDTVVIPGNSGTITTNGGEKKVGEVLIMPSTGGPPPPTKLTSNDPPTSSVKITATGLIYVGIGSTVRGQDPSQPNQPGGGVELKSGGVIVIDGSVEGGDASAGTLFSNPGGKVTCTGGKVGSINGGRVKGGKGSDRANGPGGGGGPVEVKGDPLDTRGKFSSEGGAGGSGNPPGKKGTVTINGQLQARLERPATMTGDSVLVLVTGAGAEVTLTDLPSASIVADADVTILSTGTIDLRGNPAGVDVIQAGNSIRLCGTILLDTGVSLSSITNPDAIIDCSGLVSVPSDLGLGLALGRPIPNPARGFMRIPFALPQNSRVRLAIYDVRGARLRTLIDAALPAGPHHASWDGLDDVGRPVAAGVLFLKLDAGGGKRTGTLLWLR